MSSNLLLNTLPDAHLRKSRPHLNIYRAIAMKRLLFTSKTALNRAAAIAKTPTWWAKIDLRETSLFIAIRGAEAEKPTCQEARSGDKIRQGYQKVSPLQRRQGGLHPPRLVREH